MSTGPSIPYRDGAAPGEWSVDAATHAGNAEVITEYGNTGLTHAAQYGLHVFDVQGALGAVQQNVMPVGRIEILDCFKLQPRGLDLPLQADHLLQGPKLVRVSGHAPRLIFVPCGLIVARV